MGQFTFNKNTFQTVWWFKPDNNPAWGIQRFHARERGTAGCVNEVFRLFAATGKHLVVIGFWTEPDLLCAEARRDRSGQTPLFEHETTGYFWPNIFHFCGDRTRSKSKPGCFVSTGPELNAECEQRETQNWTSRNVGTSQFVSSRYHDDDDDRISPNWEWSGPTVWRKRSEQKELLLKDSWTEPISDQCTESISLLPSEGKLCSNKKTILNILQNKQLINCLIIKTVVYLRNRTHRDVLVLVWGSSDGSPGWSLLDLWLFTAQM